MQLVQPPSEEEATVSGFVAQGEQNWNLPSAAKDQVEKIKETHTPKVTSSFLWENILFFFIADKIYKCKNSVGQLSNIKKKSNEK